jgi:hypothetical protein
MDKSVSPPPPSYIHTHLFMSRYVFKPERKEEEKKKKKTLTKKRQTIKNHCNTLPPNTFLNLNYPQAYLSFLAHNRTYKSYYTAISSCRQSNSKQ